MKTILTLVIDTDEKGRDRLPQLFRYAFGEFISHRGPTPKQYVEDRYPVDPMGVFCCSVYFDEKVQEVTERLELAEKVFRSDIDIRWQTKEG